MKKITLFCLLCTIGYLSSAQCSGFEIIGVKSDDPDTIKIRTTSAIPGSTRFYLTDNEWNGTSFNSGEGTFSFDTPAGGVPSGTIGYLTGTGASTVLSSALGTVVSNNSMSLSTSGDDVYLTSVNPSGSVSSSNICFVITFASGGGGTIPAGQGVDVGNFDNAVYNGTGDITNAANWTVNDNPSLISLPVKIKRFDVQHRSTSNILTFSTATELNNDHFVIERSADSRNWTEIGQVKGAGNALTEQNYQFTDDRPLEGINYYRLRQVDFDGKFEFSAVRSVFFGTTNVLSLSPSPVSDQLTIRLGNSYDDDAVVEVISATGQIVRSEILPAETIQYHIDMTTLPKGVYVVRLTAPGQAPLTKKFQVDGL